MIEITGKDLKSSCNVIGVSENCENAAMSHEYLGYALVGLLHLCAFTGCFRNLATVHAAIGYILINFAGIICKKEAFNCFFVKFKKKSCIFLGVYILVAGEFACTETLIIAGFLYVLWLLITITCSVIQIMQDNKMQTLTPKRGQFPLEAVEYTSRSMPFQATKTGILMLYTMVSLCLCFVLTINYAGIHIQEKLEFERKGDECFYDLTGKLGFHCMRRSVKSNFQLHQLNKTRDDCLKRHVEL